MTRLRMCLRDYLKMRRGLGFKLYDAGIGLLDFVAFMERKHAPITTPRAACACQLDDRIAMNERKCACRHDQSHVRSARKRRQVRFIPPSRVLTGIVSNPIDGATAWMALRWPVPAVVTGSK